MKIALYTPYLDTFGGGERYMLTIAEILAEVGEVDLLIDNHLKALEPKKLLERASKLFDLYLEKVSTVDAPLGKGSNFIKRTLFLKKYDLLIYLTDGSLFYSTAKKNFLHIQSPILNPKIKSFVNKQKIKSWDQIIYNSEFTRDNASSGWEIKNTVIYPPVDTAKISPLRKNKNILNVGRFFGYLKDKKQELMIDEFKKLKDLGKIEGWVLHLAGGMGEGDKEYVNQLKEKSKGYDIYFHTNIDFENLSKLYGESSLYWHAMGYEVDEPTKLEHFGITTVEAMAGGCVPIVIAKGGQLEIIEDKKSGFLWNSLEEFEKLTLELISNTSLRKKVSEEAVKRSKDFNKEKFKQKILELIKK